MWTAKADGALEIAIADRSLVSSYSFGTKTAEFHICTRCGIVPVATSRIDDRVYAVVNVNAFDGVDPALLRRTPMSFDGEATEDRLARRTRNWIANVTYRA